MTVTEKKLPEAFAIGVRARVPPTETKPPLLPAPIIDEKVAPELVVVRSNDATDEVGRATTTQREQGGGGRMYVGAPVGRGAGLQALRFQVDGSADVLGGVGAADLLAVLRGLHDGGAEPPPPAMTGALLRLGLLEKLPPGGEAPDRGGDVVAAQKLVAEKKGHVERLEAEAVAEHKTRRSALRRFLSGTTLVGVQQDIRATQGQLVAALDELHEAQRALAAVKRQAESASSLTRTDQGVLRLTAAGAEALASLQVRRARLDGVGATAILDEVARIDRAIDQRWQRFDATREELFARGFTRDDPQVNSFALALAQQPGGIRDVVQRAMVINDYLYQQKWQEYDRLAVAAAAAAIPGDIHAVKAALREAFIAMVDDGHGKSYATWLDAVAVCRLPFGATVKEKYARFDAVDEALARCGWRRRGVASCTIARGLAAMAGEPNELAARHSAMNAALVARGRKDGPEAGVAAMLLMTAKGATGELADRFNETFLGMVEHGFDKDTAIYGIAAVLAVLPGTLDEKVQMLYGIVGRLKEDGFKQNLGPRALMIMTGNDAELGGSAASAAQATSTSLAVGGFSIAGAMIGDLIDNGRFDLSGGFVAGGLIGGLAQV